MRNKLKHILLAGFMSVYALAHAQTAPSLERVITITFTNETQEDVLTAIGQEAKINFSYSPSILNSEQEISASFKSKTVREILESVFNGTILYKEKNGYVILTKAPPAVQKTSSLPFSLLIHGYVVNQLTDEKISEVSVYDKSSLKAVITDPYGYFRLEIDKPESETRISISKSGYRDTVLVVPVGETSLFTTIGLQPKPAEVIVVRDTVRLPSDTIRIETLPEPELPEVLDVPQEEIKSESQVNIENITDTLYRDFQFSLVPFIGTNHKLSGNVINDYSLNLLGGYSMGTQKLEVGGLFNIDRGDVKNFQVAGVFNYNGGRMDGFQIAGSFNINRYGGRGMQIGGLGNVNGGSVKGPQFAGLINMNMGRSDGLQVAGFANIQVDNYRGSQIAGFLNASSKRVTGSQISGFLNVARRVDGSQIGFLNIADTVKGASIGFLSFVRTGYHKLEFSADEIFYANIALRTGTHSFYNIVTAGMKPDRFTNTMWTIGYGVGTAPKITPWLYFNFDLTANQVSEGKWTPALNLVNKFYGGLEFQLSKNFAIAGGLTLNAYVTDVDYNDYPELFTDLIPHIIHEQTYDNKVNLKMWLGWKVALRFF